MDFSKNSVLKENYTFLTGSGDGHVEGGEHGLYNRDTRFLNRYLWHASPQLQQLVRHSSMPDRFSSHDSLLDTNGQRVGVTRNLTLSALHLQDRLRIESTAREPVELLLELEFAADFADLFEVRGWGGADRTIDSLVGTDRASFTYRAADGADLAVELVFDPTPDALDPGRASYKLTLPPGEHLEVGVDISLRSPLELATPTLPYEEWRERFASLRVADKWKPIADRAVDDLRALLLFTEYGPVPAAGIPWYVAAFGRDALLTAALLLPHVPEIARATLLYLAAHQGKRVDDFTAEAPGKIMHELRFGELTRSGRTPHQPYYGTVDATPLFVVLLDRYLQHTGDLGLVRELRPHWEAALEWMVNFGDSDGDGFLEFTPAAPGTGLTVQSWKDSEDSLGHADGTLARGQMAVSEVQGYAFDAYSAAARFYELLGEGHRAEEWNSRATELRANFGRHFWLDDMGTYALALDGEKRPLKVQNSDAGHLLWSGIVPDDVAPRLVATLFTDVNWSGWGFRTLGQGESRYNPISYHNGSVWPHDTALIALGLDRYGFGTEAKRVRNALIVLADTQADLRLPELVGGYSREDDRTGNPVPPIPYPTACRPQAWDVATIIHVLSQGVD